MNWGMRLWEEKKFKSKSDFEPRNFKGSFSSQFAIKIATFLVFRRGEHFGRILSSNLRVKISRAGEIGVWDFWTEELGYGIFDCRRTGVRDFWVVEGLGLETFGNRGTGVWDF